MIATKITKIRVYDLLNEIPTSLSYSTQRVGSGDDAGLTSALNTTSVKPGAMVDGTYVRTDLTTLPASIMMQLNGIWDDALHTAFEATL